MLTKSDSQKEKVDKEIEREGRKMREQDGENKAKEIFRIKCVGQEKKQASECDFMQAFKSLLRINFRY